MEHDQPVYVEWVDSFGKAGWEDRNDAATNELLVKSVGWLVCDEEGFIVISTSVESYGSCMAPLTIPRESVRALYHLDLE